MELNERQISLVREVGRLLQHQIQNEANISVDGTLATRAVSEIHDLTRRFVNENGILPGGMRFWNGEPMKLILKIRMVPDGYRMRMRDWYIIAPVTADTINITLTV